MTSFPYTPNPAKLREFLVKIQEVGVPSKLTLKYLESLGFKSSNDRYIRGVIQALGFVGGDWAPTDKWRLYRDKGKAPFVLAQALQGAYEELFGVYPNACERTDEELRNFFSSHTELSESTIKYVIRTFKVLCELSDFSEVAPITSLHERTTSTSTALSSSVSVGDSHSEMPSVQVSKLTPSIQIDIQIHISPDASSEQIEVIFQNMAKYIFRTEG